MSAPCSPNTRRYSTPLGFRSSFPAELKQDEKWDGSEVEINTKEEKPEENRRNRELPSRLPRPRNRRDRKNVDVTTVTDVTGELRVTYSVPDKPGNQTKKPETKNEVGDACDFASEKIEKLEKSTMTENATQKETEAATQTNQAVNRKAPARKIENKFKAAAGEAKNPKSNKKIEKQINKIATIEKKPEEKSENEIQVLRPINQFELLSLKKTQKMMSIATADNSDKSLKLLMREWTAHNRKQESAHSVMALPESARQKKRQRSPQTRLGEGESF